MDQQVQRARVRLTEHVSEYVHMLRDQRDRLLTHVGAIEVPICDPGRWYIGESDHTVVVKKGQERHPLWRPFQGAGFAWGYVGSGSTVLAKAILADATGGDLALAEVFKLEFCKEVITSLSDLTFRLTWKRVSNWLAKREIKTTIESAEDISHDGQRLALAWLQERNIDCQKLDQKFLKKNHERLRKKLYRFKLQLDDINLRLNRISNLDHNLTVQRFDIEPSDFECALYVDFKEMLGRGGYALRCSRCGEPIGFSPDSGRHQWTRWEKSQSIYHPECKAEQARQTKREYYRRRYEDEEFARQERIRQREIRQENNQQEENIREKQGE